MRARRKREFIVTYQKVLATKSISRICSKKKAKKSVKVQDFSKLSARYRE